MWYGWISCDRSEGEYLRSLGVKLGKYDRTGEVYRDCIVSDDAKNAIDQVRDEALELKEPIRFIYLLDYFEEQPA